MRASLSLGVLLAASLALGADDLVSSNGNKLPADMTAGTFQVW